MIPSLTLRDYQQEDVNFLINRMTAGCFNEQRTGKTPTAIHTMLQKGITRTLVLCPASAIYPWADAWTQWSGQPAISVLGTPTKQHKLIDTWETGALICSYDGVKSTLRHEGTLAHILQKQPQGVICDEAHRFKNPTSAVAKAVFKTMSIPHRLALTGTPAPNKPEEIYSILYWLDPERWPSYWKFIEQYFYTYKAKGQQGQTYLQILGFKRGKDLELQQYLSQISTQRKRIEVMPWLPQKDRQDIRLPLTDKQTKYLSELENYFETNDENKNITTMGVLDRLIRYRQICLAPQLLELSGESPKQEWLLTYLKDYPETPTIVFTKFTSFIKLLIPVLEKNKIKYGEIVGATPIAQRAKAVADFQSGKINLLLINIDAGKEALTLDRGECIIFTDQFPPAADIQQAEDRFVATTQARATKPHRIIRLMMKDSYDERIYKLVEGRVNMTDLINDYKYYLKEANQ